MTRGATQSSRRVIDLVVRCRCRTRRLRAGIREHGPLPGAIVVKLKRAEPIGGIVQDKQGRPILGARVFPRVLRSAGLARD